MPAAGLFFVAVALLGLWPSLGLAKVGAPSQSPAPEASAPKGPPMSRPLYLAAAGLAFFWFVSSMLQMNIFMFAEHVLRSSSAAATALLMALGVATGAGSYVAGLLSEKFEKRGLVLGAVGVALALLDLSLFGGGSLIRAVVDLVILGFSGGFFYIPLNTYLQKGSPEAVRGRNIGIANALGFGAVLLSAGAFWALSSGFGLDPFGVFLVNAGLAAAVAGGLVWKLRKVFRRRSWTSLRSSPNYSASTTQGGRSVFEIMLRQGEGVGGAICSGMEISWPGTATGSGSCPLCCRTSVQGREPNSLGGLQDAAGGGRMDLGRGRKLPGW